jgi:hypothetical protein
MQSGDTLKFGKKVNLSVVGQEQGGNFDIIPPYGHMQGRQAS